MGEDVRWAALLRLFITLCGSVGGVDGARLPAEQTVVLIKNPPEG
ncbi:hypothetical protein AB0442_28480 [Kitasatospora sp. NPDC085895]